jgi:hypothetical protein
MWTFLVNMLSSPGGEVSSKRVIGFMGFLVLSALTIISSYQAIEPNKELLECVKYITMTAIFGNTIEKFAGKFNLSTFLNKPNEEDSKG